VDDAVVCLGAGIRCTDGTDVETVFDNRRLGEDVGAEACTVDGRPVGEGEHRFDAARWAHLEGHGGWVWPGGTRLRTLREQRTGAWSDINTGSVTDPVARRYQTLWTNHGTDPEDAAYVYLLMPGAGRARLAARAADEGWLRIDANTAAAQAVTVPRLGFAAANFFAAGRAGRLSATSPSSVLVRREGRTADLHIAEPPRTGGTFEVVWHRPVREVLSAGEGVEVLGTGRALRLRVSPGAEGTSVRCTVRTG
jgi:hyaluronate lyase